MEPSVLLVPQPPNLNVQIPTKLYDYLCTGNPILVLAPKDSATWSAARSLPRCQRLDHTASERNTWVLARLIDAWRSGELWQERTVEDTAALTKKEVGQRFVRAVEEVLRLG